MAHSTVLSLVVVTIACHSDGAAAIVQQRTVLEPTQHPYQPGLITGVGAMMPPEQYRPNVKPNPYKPPAPLFIPQDPAFLRPGGAPANHNKRPIHPGLLPGSFPANQEPRHDPDSGIWRELPPTQEPDHTPETGGGLPPPLEPANDPETWPLPQDLSGAEMPFTWEPNHEPETGRELPPAQEPTQQPDHEMPRTADPMEAWRELPEVTPKGYSSLEQSSLMSQPNPDYVKELQDQVLTLRKDQTELQNTVMQLNEQLLQSKESLQKDRSDLEEINVKTVQNWQEAAQQNRTLKETEQLLRQGQEQFEKDRDERTRGSQEQLDDLNSKAKELEVEQNSGEMQHALDKAKTELNQQMEQWSKTRNNLEAKMQHANLEFENGEKKLENFESSKKSLKDVQGELDRTAHLDNEFEELKKQTDKASTRLRTTRELKQTIAEQRVKLESLKSSFPDPKGFADDWKQIREEQAAMAPQIEQKQKMDSLIQQLNETKDPISRLDISTGTYVVRLAKQNEKLESMIKKLAKENEELHNYLPAIAAELQSLAGKSPV